MTQSHTLDATAPLPRLTVCGLRFLELANIADAAENLTAAGHLVDLAFASFDGRESNIIPLPVGLMLDPKQSDRTGNCASRR